MRWVALVLVCTLGVGCVNTPYDYSRDVDGPLTLKLGPDEDQLERGRPVPFLDGLGHYVISLPSKILLLRWDVNDHDISYETEIALRAYLAANGLHNVKVRLNQYAPGGEWRRLARNKDMAAFWRWTLGFISTTFYTILPGRLFAGLLGGDNYNPYTNTINLYSDNLAVALHEAGHAKDFAVKSNRHTRGAYAAIRLLPLVPLWQEGVATTDAISYLYELDDVPGRKTSYRTLYPAYGTYVGAVGGEYGRFLPFGPGWVGYAIAYGPVVVGHVVGQVRAPFVDSRFEDDGSEEIEPEPESEPQPEPESPEPESQPAPEPESRPALELEPQPASE